MSTKAPNPVDRYVGSRVRMRRIMLGMSQEKLGDALGLTFAHTVLPKKNLEEHPAPQPRNDSQGWMG